MWQPMLALRPIVMLDLFGDKSGGSGAGSGPCYSEVETRPAIACLRLREARPEGWKRGPYLSRDEILQIPVSDRGVHCSGCVDEG